MIILGFFFAAVSGNLVGMIGSSNNPISGLTLSTLIIAALLMVSIGVSGTSGVTAVLGWPRWCASPPRWRAKMLQDLKVGHILGGTPRSMQIGDFIGIAVASLVLYFRCSSLQAANIKGGGVGFGDRELSAPQAGLMSMLAKGIVGGDMAWPLVVVGMFMGIALIMVQVRSPMLFARRHVPAARKPPSRSSWAGCSAGPRTRCATAEASTMRRRRVWKMPAC